MFCLLQVIRQGGVVVDGVVGTVADQEGALPISVANMFVVTKDLCCVGVEEGRLHVVLIVSLRKTLHLLH